jgi:hypothetical protein
MRGRRALEHNGTFEKTLEVFYDEFATTAANPASS